MQSERQAVAGVGRSAVERIYREWDRALSSNDPAALLMLYEEDAVLESPLVPHLLGTASGVVRGHGELRRLFEEVARRKPPMRGHFRSGYMTDGERVVWEYPRLRPGGEQMDFVEVVELSERGLIQRHRVYWGWYGVSILEQDAYRPD